MEQCCFLPCGPDWGCQWSTTENIFDQLRLSAYRLICICIYYTHAQTMWCTDARPSPNWCHMIGDPHTASQCGSERGIHRGSSVLCHWELLWVNTLKTQAEMQRWQKWKKKKCKYVQVCKYVSVMKQNADSWRVHARWDNPLSLYYVADSKWTNKGIPATMTENKEWHRYRSCDSAVFLLSPTCYCTLKHNMTPRSPTLIQC